MGDQRCDCLPFSIDRLLALVKASKLWLPSCKMIVMLSMAIIMALIHKRICSTFIFLFLLTKHVKDQVLMMMILDQNLGIHNSVETSSTARWVYHIYIMLLEFYHDVKVDKFHCDVRLTKYCQMLIGRLKPWKPPQKKQNERYIFFVVYAYNR